MAGMGLSHTQGRGWWHGLISQRDRMEELLAASMPAVFVSGQLLPLSLRIQYECPRRVASAIVFGNFQPMRLQSLNSLPLGSIRKINEETKRTDGGFHRHSIWPSCNSLVPSSVFPVNSRRIVSGKSGLCHIFDSLL